MDHLLPAAGESHANTSGTTDGAADSSAAEVQRVERLAQFQVRLWVLGATNGMKLASLMWRACGQPELWAIYEQWTRSIRLSCSWCLSS